MVLNTLLKTVAVTALLTGAAVAQTDTTGTGADMQTGTDMQAGVEATTIPTFTDIRDMTVGDALGWVVYDPAGDKIGEIDYIIQDADAAKGVIGIGGFLGLGEYTVALPLTDFEIGEKGMSFTLDTDKETLKAQPEFDESGAESLPEETKLSQLMEPEVSDEPAAGATLETAPTEGDTMDDGAVEDSSTMDAEPAPEGAGEPAPVAPEATDENN